MNASRRLWLWVIATLGVLASFSPARADAIQLDIRTNSLDRWMYPFNFEPGVRPVASTFASFDPRFDTRDAQFLIGWNTADLVPTHQPAARYLLRSVRLTLTIARDRTFIYDPTYDSYTTYATNTPAYTPDTDPGRPIELYGAGFRNNFTAESFAENGFFGPLNPINSDNISIGTRNVFAACFDPSGELVDIANHVGQHNASWTNAIFEVTPWAVGIAADVAPGDYVPEDTKFVFDVHLNDPLVRHYFQNAFSTGNLRLFVSSLSPAIQITPGGTGGGGVGSYPQWATKENLLYDGPRLEVDGVLVSNVDTDGDGLPDDWEQFYFKSLEQTALGDSDQDGYSNQTEWERGTDPTVADPKPVGVTDLSVVRVQEDGTVVLHFKSTLGLKHRVDVSFDLVNWRTALGEITDEGGGFLLFKEIDPTVPPFGRRQAFYRVAVE